MTDTILRLPPVMTRAAKSKSAIYDDMKKGTFPRPVRLGARAVGWKSSDLDHWMASRPRSEA